MRASDSEHKTSIIEKKWKEEAQLDTYISSEMQAAVDITNKRRSLTHSTAYSPKRRDPPRRISQRTSEDPPALPGGMVNDISAVQPFTGRDRGVLHWDGESRNLSPKRARWSCGVTDRLLIELVRYGRSEVYGSKDDECGR